MLALEGHVLGGFSHVKDRKDLKGQGLILFLFFFCLFVFSYPRSSEELVFFFLLILNVPLVYCMSY